MKQIYLLLSGLGLALLLGGCLKDQCEAERTYLRYDPIYIKTEALRQPIVAQQPQKVEQPGKIYVYGDYLLINEYEKGLHLFNNRDPRQPQPLGFLPIPGNVDLAVRNDLLYADSYVDLLVFDLSNPAQPALVQRIQDVFPHYGVDLERGLIVGYRQTTERMQVSCDEIGNGGIWRGGGFWVDLGAEFDGRVLSVAGGKGSATPGGNVGIGGSTARFTLANDFLYTVSNYDLRAFDLSNGQKPVLVNTTALGWDIETIFPYANNLFIGSRTGMHIYSLAEPARPRYLARLAHVNSCDPVVVEGDKAYVTLRSGNECDGFANQLDVVDIANLQAPKLLKSFPLHHPIGLGIDAGTLMICDDDAGLKIFDAQDWRTIDRNLLARLDRHHAFDVIPLARQKTLILTGKDGIFQYSYANPRQPEFLSQIAIAKP